ncbi:MAG: phosphoenolpyruvate--protein phosphotransferase [Lachnospiraceae bacterium]|nr:phosphoenolpyruvate--protein phosphotransferase [Lachnospiraceae bacterium]
MQIYQGKSVYEGIAIGKIRVCKKGEQQARRIPVTDINGELERFHQAQEATIGQIEDLYGKAREEMGEGNAAIFEIYEAILTDDNYVNDITTLIKKNGYNAEYAVTVIKEKYLQMFAAMDDEYLKARALDIRDISERLLDALQGGKKSRIEDEESIIVLSEELTPSEALQLNLEKVVGFITVEGSLYSHTAIFAKTRGIPALINVDIGMDTSLDGKLAIVDGVGGHFYVEPKQDVLQECMQKLRTVKEEKQILLSQQELNSIYDKLKICICANIGNIKDVEALKDLNIKGIGLLRSEFLFFERKDFPTEEEQFECYKTVLEAMQGKHVVIRTLDIGADKQCAYFHMESEENPALGMRGIRVLLENRELFLTQIKALLRASAYGNLGILYPMITSMEEMTEIKEVLEQAKTELTREKNLFGTPTHGIMIETPAAALISDLLAKEVDFFSIGTNDLTQYTLAMDRQSSKLEAHYNKYHPAILRIIRLITENAHKAGIPVSICGELSADISLTEEFIKMGVDELSVAFGMIPILQKKLVELSK